MVYRLRDFGQAGDTMNKFI